ncbi:transporter (plasmid) [Burkholderia gladioli pv. gladioli]|uniref:MetA-pathway of phenol degradation family protein n=1 Tax=Burkholderia gladioli TaxID=28095 RepID=A0AAW3EQ59_BURGA|nr:transporter [Burkholderia gladioli]AJW93762.1 metA-pathway of phenol degradation family protein [Burkholderia gladioli]ASD84622.1 phenol degradation protein meta [Burkholderia gladioli pv. gladioli]AWY49859.1 phenol degradation protein meta [Burkholderia gladioli pv. gladioli]KGC09842.1 metA-pathway of phenol degradation family protein [Burkholderia gladioli]MDJ1167743.1 transporter [Burkholderia gladioli pv. gladioli]
MNRNKLRAAMLIAVACMCADARATENGLQSYPLGVNTVLNGIVPTPGTSQFYNYTTFYTADRFAGPNGGSAVPGFKTDVFVETPRILHTWGNLPGPFTFTSGLVVPLVHTNIGIGGASDSRWGLGDIVVHPLIIGYANLQHYFFATLALDFSVPTGSFSSTRLANTGINSYSFMPNVNITYFPFEKVETSVTAGYEINSPDRQTGYHSGNLAFLDWIAGYAVTPKWQLGIQGYVLKQTTDDTLNGAVFDNGFRGRVYAIGPQVRFNFNQYSGVVLKWQHEFGAQNRPRGDRIWLEFTVPFNG